MPSILSVGRERVRRCKKPLLGKQTQQGLYYREGSVELFCLGKSWRFLPLPCLCKVCLGWITRMAQCKYEPFSFTGFKSFRPVPITYLDEVWWGALRKQTLFLTIAILSAVELVKIPWAIKSRCRAARFHRLAPSCHCGPWRRCISKWGTTLLSLFSG